MQLLILFIASLQSNLKELRVDLVDQLNECDFDEDEPDTFNPAAFESAQQQAEKCCNECINIFNELGDRLLQITLQDFRVNEMPKDDRAQLSSMRSTSREPVSSRSPQPSTSPQHDRPVLSLDTPPAEPMKPISPWRINGPPVFKSGARAPSEKILNAAPVQQAPYRGDAVLVISPISEYREDTNHQRRPQVTPYPVSPTDQSAGRPYSDVSPLTEQPPPLIGKEIVYSRLSQNEQFLERRRQSRLLFQNEMRRSISSIEENRASQTFSDGSVFSSPRLGYSIMLGTSNDRPPVPQKESLGRNERPISSTSNSGPWSERLLPLNERPASYNERNRMGEAYGDGISPILGHSMSPIDGRTSRASANGYDSLMTRQRSQGQASQTTRSSRTSSILQDIRVQDRPAPERKDSHTSQASQESIFGLRNAAPLSPPLSEHRSSGNGSWGPLATTLQVPGFGQGVEQGIEVVDNIDRDNGLILANEDQIIVQPTPATSLKSVDAPMRPDSSFYRFGGFCEGAKVLLGGGTGFKIMKRPSVRTFPCHSNSIILTFNRATTAPQFQLAALNAPTKLVGPKSKKTKPSTLKVYTATTGSASANASSQNATSERTPLTRLCTPASFASRSTAP